ncbi:MAG: hypothetical protein LBD55_01995 [Treponema sp.]|nr:hypothetical protein [Treponema sp.]
MDSPGVPEKGQRKTAAGGLERGGGSIAQQLSRPLKNLSLACYASMLTIGLPQHRGIESPAFNSMVLLQMLQ